MGDARYMRVYREQKAPVRERLSRQCRQRAQQRLLDKHQDEYSELVNEERKKAGLPPAKRGPDPTV